MTEFETLIIALIIPLIYGVVYWAGKNDILGKSLEIAAEELENSLGEKDKEETNG